MFSLKEPEGTQPAVPLAEGFAWQEVVRDTRRAALVSVHGQVVDSDHQAFAARERGTSVGWVRSDGKEVLGGGGPGPWPLRPRGPEGQLLE